MKNIFIILVAFFSMKCIILAQPNLEYYHLLSGDYISPYSQMKNGYKCTISQQLYQYDPKYDKDDSKDYYICCINVIIEPGNGWVTENNWWLTLDPKTKPALKVISQVLNSGANIVTTTNTYFPNKGDIKNDQESLSISLAAIIKNIPFLFSFNIDEFAGKIKLDITSNSFCWYYGMVGEMNPRPSQQQNVYYFYQFTLPEGERPQIYSEAHYYITFLGYRDSIYVFNQPTFNPQHLLTVIQSDNGNVVPSGESYPSVVENLTIYAYPKSGYKF